MNKQKPTAVLLAALATGIEFEIAKIPDTQPSLLPEAQEFIIYGRSEHGPEDWSQYVHTVQGVIARQTTFSS